MKYYKVTYYDGKGKQAMYVRAKSLNDAISQGNELLRLNKIKGATVIGAERVKAESPNTSRLPLTAKQVYNIIKHK